MPNSVEITALYAGLFAMMLLAMAVYVIRARLKHQVSIGDGGQDDIVRRNRIMGNFLEYVPMILILMLILEISGTNQIYLHGIGGITLIGRCFHAYAINCKNSPLILRQIGMLCTFFALFAGALLSISSFIF